MNRPPPRLRRLALVLAALPTLLGALAATPPPQVAMPLMRTPPTVDGEIREDEWAGASKVLGLVSQHDTKLTARDAMFWVGCDGEQLFIAVKTEAPPDGRLLERAVPDGDRDILDALRDDSIELWIDPHRGQTTGDRRLFQIITNPRGTLYDRSYDLANPQNPVDVSWRVPWRFAGQVLDGWWHAEMAIPLAALGATRDLTHAWGLRVVRDWQRPWDQSRWASTLGAFEDIPSMPQVTWDAEAPVTQMLSLHRDRTTPLIAVSLRNPHDRPLSARVSLSNAWSMDPPKELQQTVDLAPGQTAVVSLEGRDGGPEGSHHTVIQVTSADGQRVFFFRDFRWNLRRPEAVWTLEKEQRQAVDLQFKHYPSLRRIKAKVDVSALSVRDRVTGVRLALLPAGAGDPLAEVPLALRDGVGEAAFAVPELADGEYRVAAYLTGGDGVPREPVTAAFQRRHFAWERNRLGRSDVVIPPFTPLAVDGPRVSCVLRQYTANAVGLWDQVRSEGQDLLAAPMRWEVSAGGQAVPVAPAAFGVDEAAPHRVVTRGGWSVPGVRATSRTEFDYDGMAKVTLTLAAAGDAPATLDRLTLAVPLVEALVPYMHTCGDGLRHNYAGRTPSGDGVVWDSSKGNKLNLVGTFYPYVYLGGGARGLCWFADSDRDWILDDTTPTVEVVRQGKVLELRVHLVTRPAVLDRPHTIVFGLQATPAKPMPSQPVDWRRWRCSKDLPGAFRYTVLGATYYWGGTSFDLYPRGGDLSFFDWIRDTRQNGQADLEFVTRWMEGYKPAAQPGTDAWKQYENHVMYTARVMPGYPRSAGTAVIPYTNPRGAGFDMAEWPTFQDEWISFAYFNRSTQGSVAYDLTPTESYRDCALYYYQKAMTCFDGVYWDNLYLSANWDTELGGAWTDDRGRVHPGLGLWDMRELVRRTAVLYHEQGRQGVFIPHMTNTDLVPVLAFANVSLDWEWQYGDRDFQDRFTPELTVAQTIGRKAGNAPLILQGGLHDPKAPAYPWAMRTRLGVCLVHELDAWDYGPAETVAFLRQLQDFGYGTPACQVFNYWDSDALRVSGVDAKWILLAQGQRALVIVTSYGETGECHVWLDAAKRLGLPATAKAKDFETGAAVAGDLTSGYTFPLKKHDFRALLVE